ncbi:hypothetical protein [Thermophilibacter provencensis]|uniref:Secreted protein n=1 Tax=Thermophilibacter provencensis TaxID=1852386 RepID=A0ABT7V5L6_9ACTN|nr:hypothetical protein [Thermophilibacter provencensis]MDM8271894.1 hypothetical protein [Thermophilibacter provencensis]
MTAARNERPSRAAGHMARSDRRAARDVAPDDKISTIHAGQGARVTTRKNAAQAAAGARRSAMKRYLERHPEAKAPEGGPERSGKNVVLLVVLGVVALVLVFLLARCVSALFVPDPAEQARQAAEQAQNEQNLETSTGAEGRDPESDQVDAGASMSYGGSTYTLQQQEDGLWAVVRSTSGSSATTLFLVEGTPACLVRYQDILLVPENRSGGWDVVSYVIDGHSDPGFVMGPDGAQAGGSGDVSSVSLDGSTLRVTDSSGATTDVALV